MARTLRDELDERLKEKQWQRKVEGALKAFKWWFSHNPPNVIVCTRCGHKNYRGIARGIPDLWIMRPPYMGWIELKTERGWVDGDQHSVQALIDACTVKLPVMNARPHDRDWLYDLIAHPEAVRRP